METVRAFCLNAILGDPLASVVGIDVATFRVPATGNTTPVEFIGQTMVALMDEAVPLVRRLESRADDAEDRAGSLEQTLESVKSINARLKTDLLDMGKRAVNAEESYHGEAEVTETLTQRCATLEADNKTLAQTLENVQDDLRSESEQNEVLTRHCASLKDAVTMLRRALGVGDGPLPTWVQRYGTRPVDASESAREASSGTDVPEGGGEAAAGMPAPATVTWMQNGDHPHDGTRYGAEGHTEPEGRVVRRFRRPDTQGHWSCPVCGAPVRDHGCIDDADVSNASANPGITVCPGDEVTVHPPYRVIRRGERLVTGF